MAEGLLRSIAGDKFEVFSAGTKPSGVNLYTIKVMKEIGIDISNQKSKSVEIYFKMQFDYVITLCKNAKQTCPFFPGNAIKIHWDLEDPAEATENNEEKTETFRKVRDEIRNLIIDFLK